MAANQQPIPQSINSTTAIDLLERILDKGIVIAGDIKIKLIEVELLTIQIQLVVCSVDKAKEIGIDWWNRENQLLQHKESAAMNAPLNHSIKQLNDRIEHLEKQLNASEKTP